ncbi:LRR receptor-like serine/threonine-protein kinase EFR [Lycium barbarum]|uniref:LRR receptor-like serine/threonine-protein kinase EFR n=1 Tax=Lycium barbarum TaxID=112863 RepID=UPI00293F26FC|nr:LRR receptor-like serine/threonine-protein kinase EFR [Lycium barbarum]
MEKVLTSFLLLFHLVVASLAVTHTNISTDQSALLSLKSQINSDPFHLLNESWSPATSVCHWVGVTCGSRHQRVKSLNISNMALIGRIPADIGNLTFLVSLDLGSNNFYGNLPQEMACLRRLRFIGLSFNNFSGEVPSWFGVLHQLRYLFLGNNSFNGSIPSLFCNISTLQSLDLTFNFIGGEIPREIGNHKHLRFLSLGGNKFIGSIPPSLSNASMLVNLALDSNFLQGNIPEEIGNLQNLKILVIETNQLTGSIPFSIFNISGIEIIGLQNNTLSGSLPDDMCDHLPKLEVLSLNQNELRGHMPLSLSNCSKLQLLGLVSNEFDGPIHSEIGHLSNLQFLYLGENHFEGMIPQEIGILGNLVELRLERNQLIGCIPISIFNISSLQILALIQNNLFGPLPGEVGNLTKLQFLELRENMLTGEIPKGMSSLIELVYIDLAMNKFVGSLPMEIFNISGIRTISLVQNNLTGTLPLNIGSTLPNIEGLYLGALNLFGIIPHTLSNCSKLIHLDLANNRLTGLISNCLGYLTHLEYLLLAGNYLRSDIMLSFLPSLSNCRHLKLLDISGNPLNGVLPISLGNLSGTSLLHFKACNCIIKREIPREIGNLTSLIDLDLSGNGLIGSIPTTISNLRFLQLFTLSHNKLSGFIGDDLCKLQNLGYLHLTHNQLSGSIPNFLGNLTSLQDIFLGSNKLHSNIPASLGNLKNLMKLDLSSNNLVGSLPPEIGNLKAVIYMDLSVNKLSSDIPGEIGGLQNLIHLSLKDNELQGTIPSSMSNMLALEFLDLSHNNVSGLIPKSLEQLQNLNYFNVSFNKLVGEIPSGGPFKNLSSQSFLFNEALCGSQRFHVPSCRTSTSKHRSKRRKVLVIFLLAGIALFVLAPIAFFLVWIRFIRGKRNAPRQTYSDSSYVISTRRRLSYHELLQATDSLSESNLIGSGSFGSVYKGILRDGTLIAAKVFNLQLQAALRSFDRECQVLRNLRHRNLTKVITSCSNLEFKALVLEYMPNGSLDKWLYSHNYFLDIEHRLSLMIDVACALEYLHHGCSLPVIHCDLKPSNVLLDEDMVGHLSDFGISKLLSEDESASYTKTLATLGYIAPEYGLEGLVSTKCDVYSYGIMLMETFTRTKPSDEMFDGALSLKQWVSNSLPHSVTEVVDANLITPRDNHLERKLDCVVSTMNVAMDCCVESPRGRINMKDVVARLKMIQIQHLA